LTLAVVERAGRLLGMLEFNTDLFRTETIVRLADHYRTLVRALVADPEALVDRASMLGRDERRLLLSEWNMNPRPYPRSGTLHADFARQVARSGNAVALEKDGRTWTYRELDERAEHF